MGELRRSERILPLYASIPVMMLAIAYASIMSVLGWHHGNPDWRGIVAGFPFVGLWFYGSLVLLLVKAHVEVNANDVSIYYRPIPCGAKSRQFTREEIAQITLDRIHVAKEGLYWCIGLSLVDGRQIFLPERHSKESDARERVAAINSAMAAGVRPELPVGSILGPTRKKDWGAVRAVIIWGVAFLSAIVWGLVIEISRYKSA